jgi:hypothetical protein
MQNNQAYYLNNNTSKHNWIGLIGTTFIHGAIFLALYFFILVPPNPPWADQGASMILGEENMGGEACDCHIHTTLNTIAHYAGIEVG